MAQVVLSAQEDPDELSSIANTEASELIIPPLGFIPGLGFRVWGT